jgi:hypothetical protein
MTQLRDVTRSVRSKVAGPFWVTIDIFFKDKESYLKYKDSDTISAGKIASYYEVDRSQVKFFQVDNLDMIKISLPRKMPQGGILERDMHSGQQYVRLLKLPLE